MFAHNENQLRKKGDNMTEAEITKALKTYSYYKTKLTEPKKNKKDTVKAVNHKDLDKLRKAIE